MFNITFEEFNNIEFGLYKGNPIIKNPLNSFVIADPSVITPDVSHDKKWHLFCHTFFGVYRYVSDDGITFEKAEKIVSRAMRPNINRIGGKYYLFFGANDVHEGEIGGIGVAVADNPAGPFKDLLGKPLIGEIVNGAQPIDQYVFKDKDGSYYMYYGGWSHCNVVKLADDFKSIVPFEDGTLYKEVTPQNYVEGPFMFMRNGKYYFMWSEGGWTGPNYKVAYAISDSPFGPFERKDVILQQDDKVARGAGHHSVVHNPRSGKYYIIYHRRPIDSDVRDNRVTCIEEMHFDENGDILPVVMTHEGVAKDRL